MLIKNNELNFSVTKTKQSNQCFSILIVDDDKIVSNIFGEILSNRGHNVIIVHDCASCINKCQNTNFDIIFMDFHMDNINGVDMTDLLKNVCNNKSIIFALTGDDSKKAINQFKNIGMNGAIIKPLNIDLINKLMNSLEIKKEFNKKIIKTLTTASNNKQLFLFD